MLNKVTLMGRLTKDPELRYTQSNTAVTSFTLAVDRDYTNKDTGEKETDFIDFVAWRHTAEFVCKYFSKGRMAVVSGRLQVRYWEDNDGKRRKAVEVVAENVYFGDSKKDSASNGGYQQPYGNHQTSPKNDYNSGFTPADGFTPMEEDDDELPF